MAIEDAIALARELKRVASQGTIDDALRAYERSRMGRTAMITRTSWRLGRIGQWRNPAACAIRDALIRLATPGAIERAHRRVAGHLEPDC